MNFSESSKLILGKMSAKYPELKSLEEKILNASLLLIDTFKSGGKVLVCGNGGSAADSEHIVGELLKGFLKKRPLDEIMIEKINKFSDENIALRLQLGLPAISLVSQSSIISAIANDQGADLVYAQQLIGLGKENDLLIGISTSGNAVNVLNAMKVAKSMSIRTLALTGEDGGKMAQYCDILLNVPQRNTPCVQEYHLPVYHAICAIVEECFYTD